MKRRAQRTNEVVVAAGVCVAGEAAEGCAAGIAVGETDGSAVDGDACPRMAHETGKTRAKGAELGALDGDTEDGSRVVADGVGTGIAGFKVGEREGRMEGRMDGWWGIS